MLSFYAIMKKIRRTILLILFILVVLTRMIKGWGDFYSQTVYPLIATPLSTVTSWLPFCLTDIFYILIILVLITYPFIAIYHYHNKKLKVFLNEAECFVWLYVWFYVAWGLNYSQSDYYARTNTQPAEYNKKDLQTFANDYLQKLNASYIMINRKNEKEVREAIMKSYTELSVDRGIHAPFTAHPRVKTMMLSWFYSKVGVLGAMGPFWCEYTINHDMLPCEYASSYAHEYAHYLGTAREGEATFYAYLACTSSSNPKIKFSGYLYILPYVTKALYAADENLGNNFVSHLRPEILKLHHQEVSNWRSRYSKTIGEFQNFVFDHYLKSNSVSNGIHNYSNVIGLIISTNKNYNRHYDK